MSLFQHNLFKHPRLVMSLLLTLVTLGDCGSSGGGATPPAQMSVTVSANQVKVLRFSWNDVGADH